MTRKFHVTLIVLLVLIISASVCCFTSCSDTNKRTNIDPQIDPNEDILSYYPPKPEDTNLKLWIGDVFTKEELDNSGMAFIPRPDIWGLNGYYLDTDYEPVMMEYSLFKGQEFPREPDTYAYYEMSYFASNRELIERIQFNDPKITLYGLTINSTREEVDARLLELGFEIVYFDRVENVYNPETGESELVHNYLNVGQYKKDYTRVSFKADYVSISAGKPSDEIIIY